jgi:mannose-6-phosphate isomerase-like protein (cupin superfamily)
MSHAHIDDLDRIPIADGIVYRPIRRRLGVTAFGANAYTASTPGEHVIEPHDETSPGSAKHEELYVVLTGHAAFKVGDEQVDAPAGTLVVVPPGTQREATATRPETTVLVIGGAPGAAGPISPFEYWYAAQPAYDAGDYDRAYEIASEGLRDHPRNGPLNYQLACYTALGGKPDVARGHLAIAYEEDARTREWAKTDEDLRSIV